MKHTITPSAIRSFVYRHKALSALRSNSPLPVRLTRYNAAMVKARALEVDGGVL